MFENTCCLFLVKSEGVNVIPNSRIKGIKRASNGRYASKFFKF